MSIENVPETRGIWRMSTQHSHTCSCLGELQLDPSTANRAHDPRLVNFRLFYCGVVLNQLPRLGSDPPSPAFCIRNLQMEKMTEKVDRLSDLPEGVRHQIFSSIDTKQSVQTCILSKTWRSFWKSLPFLNFRGDDTHKPFKKFIEKVFSLHECSNLKSLRLCCNFNTYTNRWILAALQRNVEEIYVHLNHINLLCLPECLFVSNSLTTLELKLLDTDEPLCFLNISNVTSLPRLRTLVLDNFWILDDDMRNIMSGCPVLETFSLIGGYFSLFSYCICSHSLKHLVLGNGVKFPTITIYGYTINIYAPNLVSFCCRGTLSASSLQNICVFVKADIEIKQFEEDNNVERMITFHTALHNVETITLSSLSVEVTSSCVRSLVGSEPFQLCNLRHLKLQTCLSRKYFAFVPYLLKIFPKIESLDLEIEKEVKQSCSMPELEYPYEDNVTINQMILTPELDYPYQENVTINQVREAVQVMSKWLHYHLKFVEIRRFEGHQNELVFLEILMKNAIALEKLVLYVSAKAQSSHSQRRLRECVNELLSSPRTSSNVQIMLV